MGDWKTVTMPEPLPVLDLSNYGPTSVISSLVQTLPPLSQNSYNLVSAFCTDENIGQCITYINQEISSLGFPPISSDTRGNNDLNLVSVLNVIYELLQLHKKGLRTMEDMETEQLKSSSDMDHLQNSHSKLKEQLELCRRENKSFQERERQVHLKNKSLQNSLKNEKEEVQKLQNVIASRASQYNHDMKRKEREFGKLKERLNQILIDKKDKKMAIEILNYVGRPDGKRSVWKTGKTEARNEEEMYKVLLGDYEHRLKDLMIENAELKKVLQQMKKEMMTILHPQKHGFKEKKEESIDPVASDDEEEPGENSKEYGLDLSCELAREKLTNSIRQQWRMLKNHVEKLDNQAALMQMDVQNECNVVSREIHEEEVDKLKLEIQQCKDFIKTQQQLWQQQVNSPCDEETSSLLQDCYLLEEKERLKEEWKLFDEQRKNFERERKNFTEAAIRLGHERRAFEEDRASWLKHQFLNMTPFIDRKRPQTSKHPCAFSASTEPEVRNLHSSPQTMKSVVTNIPTPKSQSSLKMPSTPDLYQTLCLIPNKSSPEIQPKRSSLQDPNVRMYSGELSTPRPRHSLNSDNYFIYCVSRDENTLK
ncbi:synovial sarcoma, X breakpoint 2 interacting protein a [Erpetoichthys calabaricus]|uniref:Synovial sarcoma, X breakpoint 2 interacting protein a n=1 Tax=Erpetoichthys calabaricus TaxID=27687 RepID=A0A8C4SD99_ERPCA|nr:synovial sarcoma, X breakpoint 2 interacting protein a [Erpetoichthys calabaricus]XP_028667370.1 synovial sarcoma, X breakpoint 2 interacting protein a [Erpetoichthys calabaricus]XP_028667371.1 synovial sarcoma, X breakpoint 2 interacting protein a [Erpetoichthys calabaricus]